MRILVLFPVALFYLFALVACTSSRPVAHMIINNESSSDVPFNLSIIQHNNLREKTFTNTIKPGLQELAVQKFCRGGYSVTAQTNDGTVSVTKNLALDTDRWIIITYTKDDSLSINRKYGYVDTASLKKINGKYTGLDIYIENRKPPTL